MKILTCLAAVAVAAVFGGDTSAAEAVSIRTAQDVISHWQEGQHLYIKGELGISAKQLDGLEAWLDENGPHWVVVLMQDADNESYRAADGRTYVGMDAVEHALGYGLSNRTGFGELLDARTEDSDGAVFVIFLRERKFSYFASDAQDRRRLGEAHWQGELDQPAFRAMRGGMRIRDAVKDTVTSINRRLQRTIDQEIATAKKAEAEREEAYQQLMIRIAALSEEIVLVGTRAEEFQVNYPKAIGELTEPPVQDWNSELSELEEQMSDDTTYQVSQDVASLHDRVAEYLNAYALAGALDDQSAELEKRLDGIAVAHDGVAKPTVEEARQLLSSAREERAAGRFGFVKQLRAAAELAGRGDREVAAEKIRLERQARIRNVMRKTAAGTGLLTLGGLGVLGFVLNRKRYPTMQQAREIFAERKESVGEEVQKVFQLFERSGEVLGSKERITDRGYEGQTRELSEKTFENVDDLIVMSSEVERVMGEAESLIHPKNPLSKAINVFSGSRYAQGIERISGKPLEFRRDKGLPLALEEDGVPVEGAGEVGPDGQPPESIRLTFEDVFARFHDRSERATVTLDRIETSLLEVNDGLAALQGEIDAATADEQRLAALAEENDYFRVPAFFEALIPSAQADSDEADSISGSDPVKAVSEQLPSGTRKVTEARHLANSLLRGHEQVLPRLRRVAPQLEAAGYDATWVDDRLTEMTDHANQLFAKAAVESVAEEAEEFGLAVDAMAERADRCLEISQQLDAELEPSVTKLAGRIEESRQAIGQRLSLPIQQVLHEKPRDPDDDLAAAQQQVEVIKAALNSGNVEVASEGVSNLQREVDEGNQTIDDTLKAIDEFDSALRTRQEETAETQAKLPPYESKVAKLEQQFVASTQRLQTIDPTFPDEEATIHSHRDACRQQLAESERLLKLSREFFDKGRVLEATAMLDAVHEDVQLTNQMFLDLDEHSRMLDELLRTNEAELAKLVSQIDRMNDDVSDRRTMRPTMEFFQDKVQAVQLVAHEVESQKHARDPIAVAAQIEKLTIEFEEVDARVEADRNAHAEANRAVDSGASELASGRRLVQRARQDGIPDNRATGTLVQDIESFDAKLGQVRNRLEVPHDDWKEVHEQAVVFHSQLSESTGKLRGELQRASAAAETLESASRTVFEAARWTGGWGVRIFGSPGSKELERARAALHQADYNATIELSRAASMVAGHSIQKAQREVARRQRDQMRQAEKRRRQRSISIGSTSGGGRRASSSRRVSSGRSRSRSNNSGFSRSGW